MKEIRDMQFNILEIGDKVVYWTKTGLKVGFIIEMEIDKFHRSIVTIDYPSCRKNSATSVMKIK